MNESNNFAPLTAEDYQQLTDEDKADVLEALKYCSSLAAVLGTTLGLYGESKKPGAAAADPVEIQQPAPHQSIPEAEDNPDPEAQLLQIDTFLRPEIRALFGADSALYELFHLAMIKFGAEDLPIEQQTQTMDKSQLLLAWVLARQSFALRHFADIALMLEALHKLWTGSNPQPLSLPRASDKDTNLIDYFSDALKQRLKKKAKSSRDSSDAEEEDEDGDPPSLRAITEIIATGNLFLPTAKAFREQINIAAGIGTAKLDVGKGAIIKAKITGADGKDSVHLTKFEMDIEATVGQLFQENGFHTITVTPAQIYRKYSGMDTDDSVSPESVQKTIEALDKLIMTPAILDFTQQIEKHTRLKRRPHFDYESRSRKGTLITGVHDKKRSTTYRGTVVEDSFTIFDMPMFYAYSYAIGQLTTVPINLLTGEPAKAQYAKKTHQKKINRSQRLTSEDIGLRRYLLEQIEYQKGVWDKKKRKLRDTRKEVPETYDAYLLFSSIAEGVGYDVSTPKRSRSLREQVYAFMQEQAKLKNIKAAEYHIKGKAFIGVKVTI